MNNYEYIISCLPVLDSGRSLDPQALVDEIRSQCSAHDNALIDLLEDSFNPDRLDAGLYKRALSSSNAFIREYLLWDLQVRNTKAQYLNRVLERPEDTDVIDLPGAVDYDAKPAVEAVLARTDILERERGLDSLMWDKAEDLVRMRIFDLDVILAFIARLRITDRWNRLDPQTGRTMFRRLVDEIRKTR